MTRRQWLAIGLGDDAIDHRAGRGRLHRVHRGVYSVGHRVLSRHGVWMAAVLVADGAVLSHRSAAALWRIHVGERGRVEITVVRALRTRSTLAIRQGPLPADEVTTRHGIPVTTPARTLLDLAAVVAPERLERARPRRRSSASRARSRSPIS